MDCRIRSYEEWKVEAERVLEADKVRERFIDFSDQSLEVRAYAEWLFHRLRTTPKEADPERAVTLGIPEKVSLDEVPSHILGLRDQLRVIAVALIMSDVEIAFARRDEVGSDGGPKFSFSAIIKNLQGKRARLVALEGSEEQVAIVDGRIEEVRQMQDTISWGVTV